ncbi:unnamed protein product [Cunninghamella blakesleeana]
MNSVYYNDIQQSPFNNYDESLLMNSNNHNHNNNHNHEEQEKEYFDQYDHVMTIEAERFDQYEQDPYYYNEYQQEEEDEEMNMNMEEVEVIDDDEQENDHPIYQVEDDALLKLIVGVQSYLASSGADRHDSPLMDLQYKMYIYMKQRALDMGVDADAL